MSPDDLINKFREGVKNIAALSLETGITTEVAVPYQVITAFKNLASIGLEINYSFKQLKNAQSGSSTTSSANTGSAPAQSKTAAKQEAPKEEAPKEEEEDVDMGGLFD